MPEFSDNRPPIFVSRLRTLMLGACSTCLAPHDKREFFLLPTLEVQVGRHCEAAANESTQQGTRRGFAVRFKIKISPHHHSRLSERR